MHTLRVMLNKVRTFLANVAMRIVWSIAVSALVSLAIIALARCAGVTQIGLWEMIKRNFPPMLLAFFVPSFSLLFFIYLVSVASQKSEPEFWLRIEKKLRHMNENTRRLIADFLKWTGLCLVLIGLVFLALMLSEVSMSTPRQFPDIALLTSFYLPFLLGSTLVGTARFLMNPRDWTIHYMQRFRRGKVPEDLDKALRNYNRTLGSSLSLKRLLSISQCVNEAYKIGNRKDWEDLDSQINHVIGLLKNKNISDANNGLITLSKSAMKLIEEHKQTLGFKVTYPLRLRIWEGFRESLAKVFSGFMLFLVWFALYIFLTSLGLIPTPPPL